MIAICHRKANVVQKNIYRYQHNANTKYFGEYALIQDDKLAIRSIAETFRIIDAIDEEKNYIKEKYPVYYKLIDQKARNCFNVGSTTISMIKCSYSFNHYATRDKIINYGTTVEECSWCSQKETWSHMI